MALLIIIVILLAVAILYEWMVACGKPAPKWIAEYRYAHRGLHTSEYPENTMPAFLRAMERGYGIELDVRLSADEKVIVFHDATLDRVTDKSGDIGNYTAAELCGITVGGTQYTIPLLEDVLRKVEGRVPVLIEIKSEGAAGRLEEEVLSLMGKIPGRYAVQSFSPLSIGWFRQHAPRIPRGQLSAEFGAGAEHIARIKRAMVSELTTNFLCRPNFISYQIMGVGKRVVRRARKTRTPILGWVVSSLAEQVSLQNEIDTVIFEDYEP